jgi:hypothetical protein
MPAGRGGGVISPDLAAIGDEAVKAVIVATPANTMPATVKPPIVLNNIDFKFLYDILISPYSPCGASACGPSERQGRRGSDDPR